MGYGHLYVQAEPAQIVQAIQEHLAAKGFERFTMKKEQHPKQMKEINEMQMRLCWLSPRLNGWTGIFEFRFYNNDERVRWGFADGELARVLSQKLQTRAYHIEVVDSAGFWMYIHYVNGEEKDSHVYQAPPVAGVYEDKNRYLLNDLIKREGIVNVGLGYEMIPGEMVCPVGLIRQSAKGIEGYEQFQHLAFRRIGNAKEQGGKVG